jgi:hypothetical protein
MLLQLNFTDDKVNYLLAKNRQKQTIKRKQGDYSVTVFY